MKVKVLCANGYNYIAKDGSHKEGMSIIVCTIESENTSDGNGNFTVGHRSESVRIPRSFPMDANDVINLVGKDVELVYERKLGQRYEELVDIKELS